MKSKLILPLLHFFSFRSFATSLRAANTLLLGLVLSLMFAWAPPVPLVNAQGENTQPQIAVWDFNLTEMSKSDGQAIANSLRSALVNTRVFKVMTRDQIDTLLGEQALGQTLVDAKEAIKAGKLKGVKYVVTGSLISLRGAYQGTFEMINGGSGEIVHSITPRTFRGDFLDFLDIEVPKIAVQMAGVEKGALNVSQAKKPKPVEAPLEPKPGLAKRIIYIPPGDFSGHGRKRFEKENDNLVEHLKQVLAKNRPTYGVVQPFIEANRGKDPEVEKLRRKNLRKTIWGGVIGLGIGSSANVNYIKNISAIVGFQLALLIKTDSSIFSGGDSGKYDIVLYSPNSGLKWRKVGEWERSRYMDDLGEGLLALIEKFERRR